MGLYNFLGLTGQISSQRREPFTWGSGMLLLLSAEHKFLERKQKADK